MRFFFSKRSPALIDTPLHHWQHDTPLHTHRQQDHNDKSASASELRQS
jgi:hypothetical protein